MIIDLRHLPKDELLTADLCIIGAGVAGITLALELIDSDLNVLVLEAGGMNEEPAIQALYAGEVVDARLHSPPDTYRQRRFGGTSTIWGGRCMPFDAIDFESRDYVAHSGWPIGFADLMPYYPRANKLCETGEFAYTAEAAFSNAIRPMIAGFESSHFTANTLERFSCPTDFGARYGHRLQHASNIRILLHANVTHMSRSESGAVVEKLHATTLEGRSATVKAKKFVIAAGGLETARLLLTNNIGNDRDTVGRYYMCHLAGTVGTLRFNKPLTDIWHGYDVSDEGIYCRRRLALRHEIQRSQKIGNFVARLHHPRITLPEHHSAVLSLLFLAKPFIPYEYAKRLHGDEKTTFGNWLSHVWNVCRRPFDATGFAWHMLRDRRFADRKFPSIIVKPRAPIFSLDFHAEQEPNPASRITLSSDKDALGMPRIKIDWRYTPSDIATVTRAIKLLADDLRNSGAGTMDYEPDSLEYEMTRYGAYGGHHIGTARMGNNPFDSVVNTDCRVHDVNNLFIASAAVFPTSSQANPTLTVVALALRLADHLRKERHV
jgi:choline dehydrogenase-like flavoprotein